MKAKLDWKHRGFIHAADIGSFLFPGDCTGDDGGLMSYTHYSLQKIAAVIWDSGTWSC